jgi:hypothetical protein
MSVLAIILAVTGVASCTDPVYSISELVCPIQYIDKKRGYFIGVEKGEFTIGTALNNVTNPTNDVPQVDGRIGNCSSSTFKCLSVGELLFVVPKGKGDAAKYLNGPKILIKRTANGGWHGSAACSRITSAGCEWDVGSKSLVEAYQYDVSSTGILKAVKIQIWDDNGRLLSAHDLVLVSEIGLKLN